MRTATTWRLGLAAAVAAALTGPTPPAGATDPCCRKQGCVPCASPTFGFYPTLWRPFPAFLTDDCHLPPAPAVEVVTPPAALPAAPATTPPAAPPRPPATPAAAAGPRPLTLAPAPASPAWSPAQSVSTAYNATGLPPLTGTPAPAPAPK